MSLVCFKCGKIFNKTIESSLTDFHSIINEEEYIGKFCPDLGCEGFVADIDEMFIPIILALNKKGYPTRFCCSGHIYNFQSYIQFANDIKLPNSPQDYILENSGNYISNFSKNNRYELPKILENINNVNKWLIELPENKNHWKLR